MKGWLLGLFLAFTIFGHIQTNDDDLVDVEMTGEHSWEMIYHIDNTGRKNEYFEKREVTKSVKTSYSELKNQVLETSLKTSMKLKEGAIFEIINIGLEGTMDSEINQRYEETVETKREVAKTEKITRDFKVGADSKGEMYQLVFHGPGITFKTGTISTEKLPLSKVIINCKVKKVKMLEKINVLIDGNAPSENLITETNGKDPDTNSGQGGRYVYLQSVWTDSKNNAVTGVQVVLQEHGCEQSEDMAIGAGGKFRCLVFLHEVNSNLRIRKVGLLRSPKSSYIYDKRHEYGWDECTQDINDGRGGDWLHLCWNTITV